MNADALRGTGEAAHALDGLRVGGAMDRMTDCDRILVVLRAWKGEFVPHLYRITGCMVHSRIADLRRKGYQIESKCFGRGDYRYRLLEGAEKREDA